MAVIYDVGMHNGDDTEYYLAKGAEVVAIEADPRLCAAAEERFADAIESSRLAIINAAVAEDVGEATFFVHKEVTEWNSLLPPRRDPDMWDAIQVATAPLHSFIRKDKPIEFVKIDIEGYDLQALDSLAEAGIVPGQISCEAHKVDILCKLICMGYERFRLVNCKVQRKTLRRAPISTFSGEEIDFSFSRECSGPYREDLKTEWVDKDQAMFLWCGRTTMLGPGWYDIHAMKG